VPTVPCPGCRPRGRDLHWRPRGLASSRAPRPRGSWPWSARLHGPADELAPSLVVVRPLVPGRPQPPSAAASYPPDPFCPRAVRPRPGEPRLLDRSRRPSGASANPPAWRGSGRYEPGNSGLLTRPRCWVRQSRAAGGLPGGITVPSGGHHGGTSFSVHPAPLSPAVSPAGLHARGLPARFHSPARACRPRRLRDSPVPRPRRGWPVPSTYDEARWFHPQL
jgi:hypothetical protein